MPAGCSLRCPMPPMCENATLSINTWPRSPLRPLRPFTKNTPPPHLGRLHGRRGRRGGLAGDVGQAQRRVLLHVGELGEGGLRHGRRRGNLNGLFFFKARGRRVSLSRPPLRRREGRTLMSPALAAASRSKIRLAASEFVTFCRASTWASYVSNALTTVGCAFTFSPNESIDFCSSARMACARATRSARVSSNLVCS